MSDLIIGHLLHWHSHLNSLTCALDRRNNRIMSRTHTHTSDLSKILFYYRCVRLETTELHRCNNVVLCKWYRISIQKEYVNDLKTRSSPLSLQILWGWIQGIGQHRGPAPASQLFWTANVSYFRCTMESLFWSSHVLHSSSTVVHSTVSSATDSFFIVDSTPCISYNGDSTPVHFCASLGSSLFIYLFAYSLMQSIKVASKLELIKGSAMNAAAIIAHDETQ